VSTALFRLLAELRSDREALVTRLDRLDAIQLQTADDADLALAAWLLHHAYTGLESILERVTRAVEGDLPEGAHWHRELLDLAALEIPSVRPALLRSELLADLHELRGFRRFVRHGYRASLDPERLAALQARARRLRPPLVEDLIRVEAWIETLAHADRDDAT